MAISASCNPLGPATDKLGRLVHQEAPHAAEGSLLLVDCKKGIKGTDHGRHLISISPSVPNNNQANRFASIAVAATAWAGLSMCPVEALAMAYEGGEHRNVSESVLNTPTSMSQVAGYVKLPGDFIMLGDLYEEEADAEVEAGIGNVPSIKPPNEGSNSPWVPKINGLKKKDDNRGVSMRCPKWTESELEMVLPDFQGWPKPFPRVQGKLYPFWPATTSTATDKADDSIPSNQDKFKQASDELMSVDRWASSMPNGIEREMDERAAVPSFPALPPAQQSPMPIKKPSCFTM